MVRLQERELGIDLFGDVQYGSYGGEWVVHWVWLSSNITFCLSTYANCSIAVDPRLTLELPQIFMFRTAQILSERRT